MLIVNKKIHHCRKEEYKPVSKAERFKTQVDAQSQPLDLHMLDPVLHT